MKPHHRNQRWSQGLAAACLLLATGLGAKEEQFTLGRTLLLGMGEQGAVIPLVVCRQTKEIKVKAERDLRLDHIRVTYGNNSTKTLRFNRDLKADKETSWHSLGTRRCVKKIEVFGHSEGSKAGVKVFGRRD